MPIVPCKPGPDGDTYNTDNYWLRYHPPERTRYTDPVPLFWSVGVDLGSVNDSTSICIVEVQQGFEVLEIHPHNTAPQEIKRTPDLHYLVRLMHRPKLGVSYPTIVNQVQSIMEDLPQLPQKSILLFDGTGLGQPVVQMARKQGLNVTSVAITAGQVASISGRDWSVPKALLVGELRLAMHRNRVKVAEGFSARETLRDELFAFTARLSPSGRATFEAAASEHDDTVISLAFCIFGAKQRFGGVVRVVPITGF